MKIAFLSFLSLCTGIMLSLNSYSQKATFELTTGIKKGNLITSPFHSTDYSYFVITEKEKTHRLILNKLDSTFIYKTEDEGQSNVYPNKGCNILSSITTADESLSAVYDSDKNLLYFETVNLKTEYYTTDGLTELNKETIIGSTVINNTIITVTHPKKERFLKFYFKQTNKPVFSKEISFLFLEDKTGKGKNLYEALDNIAVIDFNTANDHNELCKLTKLYITKDEIVVTDNHQFDSTNLYVLDTSGFLIKRKAFPFDRRFTYNKIPDQSTVNSFYKDGILFAAEVFSFSLEIRLYFFDAETGTLLTKHTAKNNEELFFKNAPIYQEGGSNIFTKYRKRELNFNQFVSRLSGYDVFVTAKNYAPGLTEFWIGSYRVIKGSSAPIMMPSGGFTGGVFFSFSPGFSSSWSKTIYMRSLFRNDDFKHQKGQLNATPQEKRDNYSDEMPNSKFSKKFRSISKEYLFHLNPDDKKIHVTEFGN